MPSQMAEKYLGNFLTVRNYVPNVCRSECLDFQSVFKVKVLSLEYPKRHWTQITPETKLSSNCCIYLTCSLCEERCKETWCKEACNCASSLHAHCTKEQQNLLKDAEHMKRVRLPMDEFILPMHLGHSVIGSRFDISNLNQGALNFRQYFGVNVCAASFVGNPERKVDKKKSGGGQ